MRSLEYENPPKITKEISDEFDKKSNASDKEFKKILKGPILDRPATTRLKSKDIFIEQQRLKK